MEGMEEEDMDCVALVRESEGRRRRMESGLG